MATGSSSAPKRPNGSAVSQGTFASQVPKAWNNVRLYNLVESMANNLDEVNSKLDTVLDLLRDKLPG